MQIQANKVLADSKVNIKILLAGFWVVLMILYIYADIFSLYRTGQIEKMISGHMGPFIVSQASLLIASLLMTIPALMIIVTLMLKSNINKIINITVAFVFSLIEIGNMVGDIWVFWIAYGVLELLITVSIIILSLKWPKK